MKPQSRPSQSFSSSKLSTLLSNAWKRYIGFARTNNLPAANPTWRDYLFANAVAYSFPLGLICATPGALAALGRDATMVAMADLTSVLLLAVIALMGPGHHFLRQILYGIAWYPFSVVVLWELGADGQGLIFLLSIVIVNTVIFGRLAGILALTINAIICVFFGFAIHENLNTALALTYTPGQWFAVTTSLNFPSVVLCLLISNMTENLEKKVNAETILQEKLRAEKRELKKSLKHVRKYANDLKSLSFATAHHFKEPLKLISSFAALVREECDLAPDHKVSSYLDYIAMSIDRSFRLLSSLRAYTDVGTNRVADAVDIPVVIETVISQIRHSSSCSIKTINSQISMIVCGNATEIKYLLSELLTNAIYFCHSEETPTILIQLAKNNNFGQISISDSGIGINPENMERAFGLFEKLDHSNTDRPGLGLAICRRIAEAHGGTLRMTANPNQGVTLVITIPIAPSSQSKTNSIAETNVSTQHAFDAH